MKRMLILEYLRLLKKEGLITQEEANELEPELTIKDTLANPLIYNNLKNSFIRELLNKKELSIKQIPAFTESDSELLQDAYIQDLIFQGKLSILQLSNLSLSFLIGDGNAHKRAGKSAFKGYVAAGMPVEKALKWQLQVFYPYVEPFLTAGIVTHTQVEEIIDSLDNTRKEVRETLLDTNIQQLIIAKKLSIDQVLKATYFGELAIIRNPRIQQLIYSGKFTSEIILSLTRLVYPKAGTLNYYASVRSEGLAAFDVQKLISDNVLNIMHIIAVTEFQDTYAYKKQLKEARNELPSEIALLAPALDSSYISDVIVPAFEFEDRGIFGSWDTTHETDPVAGEPLFTYRLYRSKWAGKDEIGSMQFYKHPLFCRSELGDRHNVVKKTGILEQFPINTTGTQEICASLPPTFLESMIYSATQGAKHGAVRGLSNVVNYTLTHSNQPKSVVKTAEFALYFTGLFLMTTYDNLNTFKNNRFSDVMAQSIFSTLFFMMTNLLIQFVCYGIKYLGEVATQNEWRKTGEGLIQLSRYASLGIYALNAKQNGVAMTVASIAAGSASQFAVEKTGQATLDRFF